MRKTEGDISDEQEKQAFDQLCIYSIAHAQQDSRFIHQHVVDAFAIQTATQDEKPIKIVFGLAGLYLKQNHGFNGRQVQLMHMKMARHRKRWPTLLLPEFRGSIRVLDVMNAEPGIVREQKIDAWCESIWAACSGLDEEVKELLSEFGIR
ncbi:MAG: DUF5946 family protein [Pirellulaceae bacterium]